VRQHGIRDQAKISIRRSRFRNIGGGEYVNGLLLEKEGGRDLYCWARGRCPVISPPFKFQKPKIFGVDDGIAEEDWPKAQEKIVGKPGQNTRTPRRCLRTPLRINRTIVLIPSAGGDSETR